MSVFPLNPQDRARAVSTMGVEVADYIGLPAEDRAVEGCCECVLAALEGAGWTLLPPGTTETEESEMLVPARGQRGQWGGGTREQHVRVVGPWTPKEEQT